MCYCYLRLLTFAIATAFVAGSINFGRSKGYRNDDNFVAIKRKDLYYYDHHRSLTREEELKLQLSWWNWALCATPVASFHANFTPMSGVVPKNTVFLAGYPTINLDNSSDTCKSKTLTRTGTINPGRQTVFMPLTNAVQVDIEDDWENNCTLQNEIDANRISFAKLFDSYLADPTLTEKLYFDIDGTSVEPFYLYDESKYYLSACDDKDHTLKDTFPESDGDSCDLEPFETIGGMDIGPMVGWYGIDTRTWVEGESHTYEFGSLSECITAKYVLTAKAPMVEEDKCGLFGLGIFCPIAWLKWLFGLFN